MGATALDIETIGIPVNGQWRAAITEMWASVSDRYPDPATMAALSPALCRIVSIGLVGVDSGREVALYDSTLLGLAGELPFQTLACEGEEGLLRELNRVLVAGKVTSLVTFRGRTFDVPALIHAMVSKGAKPCSVLTNAFLGSRYTGKAHVDLWDVFTSYGAVFAPGGTTLRAWAFRYGLADPKEHGSGADVAALVQDKEVTKLLTYQIDDARTNAALYKAWRTVMADMPRDQA